MARSEGKQLHQGGCLLEAPRALIYGTRPHRDREAAEQPHSYCFGPLPVEAWDRVTPSELAGGHIPFLPSWGRACPRTPCLFSYKSGPHRNESPMNRTPAARILTHRSL